MSEELELGEGDYVLKDGAAWFTVGNRSVRIVENDAGVLMISVWPMGQEMHDAIGELTIDPDQEGSHEAEPL